nr:acyltransferase [Nocardioides caldifontis]
MITIGSSSGAGRVAYLDGIRAVAIASVLALHWFLWYVPFFHGGAVGVDVFFVLSGFIITTMLWRSRGPEGLGAAWLSFVRRRVARLYPALLGLVVGGVVLHALAPGGLGLVETARRGALVLVQATSVWGATQDDSFVVPALEPFGHTWSLAVEWYFYLLWPLLLLAARGRGWSARRAGWAAAALGLGCYLLSLPLGAFWFYFGPSARFGELLAGCALALLLRARPADAAPLRVPAALPVAALTLLVLYVVLGPDSDSPVYRLVGVPLAVTTCLVLVAGGYSATPGPVHRLLTLRPVAWVGRTSYSLYLWHTVPFLLLAGVDSVPKPLLGVAALAMVAVLTLSSHYLLERPFLRSRSDVLRLAAGAPSRSTPLPTKASTRSSADDLVNRRPILAATSLRSTASSPPSASRSARNLENGAEPGSTGSPGSQSSTSAGASDRV